MASLVISNEVVFGEKKVKNVKSNQRPRWPCWILKWSEKQQHFLTPRGTFLASDFTCSRLFQKHLVHTKFDINVFIFNAVVLEKKLEIC
jgi:hypothetical protein